MNTFLVKEISNGYTLKGPSETPGLTTNRELFLPTIYAVADILTVWQTQGFMKAVVHARKKKEEYNGKE